jgi:chromosome segregation ATPase
MGFFTDHQVTIKLNSIVVMLGKIYRRVNEMSQEMDNLTLEVNAAVAGSAAAIARIEDLAAQIVAAKEDPAALQVLADHLKAANEALAAVVAPAAPAVAPPA